MKGRFLPHPGSARRGREALAQAPGREGSVEARSCRCAHCGLPVPARLLREGGERQFCCSGCRQVYTLVHEWGFDQYYRIAGQQDAALGPAKVTGRSFDDFDDERVRAEATDPAGPGRLRTRLYLEGVHCAACVWLVEKLPAVLNGVDEVRLNAGTGVAEVTWRPDRTRLSAIGRALDRLGYTPHVHRASRAQEARRAEDRAGLARVGVASACAMNLMFLHGAIYAGEHSGMDSPYETFLRWLSFGVALPVILYSARPFYQTAVAGLRAGMVHIDLPIAVALTVTFAASAVNTVRGSGALWFDSLAMLVAALLGARQLQRASQRSALERADSLRGVAFLEFARRLEGGLPDAPAVEVPLAALVPGDRVEIRSGELVPVDGVVLSGRSSLDNAVLTGEAAALPVKEGDAVYAGATNLGARLVVRVEAAGVTTRVGTLLAIVQEALARKPVLLQTTDR
ncbi:MAG TPA: heavy metal translocating P-type ATPase metal-binding domain-containing protein, partial [Vicinamibacterales bacterium]|nr:heavy metal translocating P-type ATPase metal-binding domain-containing protein [Vicinamibacterales bacterium]